MLFHLLFHFSFVLSALYFLLLFVVGLSDSAEAVSLLSTSSGVEAESLLEASHEGSLLQRRVVLEAHSSLDALHLTDVVPQLGRVAVKAFFEALEEECRVYVFTLSLCALDSVDELGSITETDSERYAISTILKVSRATLRAREDTESHGRSSQEH